MKMMFIGLAVPLACSTAAFATSFTSGPSGPSFSSGCDVAVGASVVGGGVNSTSNGMRFGGALLNVSLAANLGFSGCSIRWTNTRQMNDAAGNYSMSSHLSGNELVGVNLGLFGGATLKVDTYLQSQPGAVATASYQFPLLTLLHSVDVDSGIIPVLTNGHDTLTQVVTLSFGGSHIPLLLGLNPTLLNSPAFTSSIVPSLSEVPETGTLTLSVIGLGLVGLSKLPFRKLIAARMQRCLR